MTTIRHHTWRRRRPAGRRAAAVPVCARSPQGLTAAPGRGGSEGGQGRTETEGRTAADGLAAADGLTAADGVTAAAAPQEPDTQLQVNALQALCRQAFGFRLAMIAVAAPSALLNAGPGWGTRLVGIAVVVTFMVSYALFRDWERFGPLLLRHPTLLAADTLFGALLLISAGPDTTLAYVSVCTPLLAGLIYGWRGAAVFASLQGLILLLVHAALDKPHTEPAEILILPGLCVIAGAVGSSLRKLMLHLGEATRALAAVRARLAVTEAVDAERARLAREMHDSVAKTLHGVALAADGLACSAGAARMDPALVRRQAELVARSARRAAAESRELLTDLRREGDPGRAVDVLGELACTVRLFASRGEVPVSYTRTGETPAPPVPTAVARQLLSITSEALENAHRHARPTRVDVHAGVHHGVHGDVLRVSVRDDGTGLPVGTDLADLRRSGHFGLVGMAERAASVGARIHFGRGEGTRGTEVRLELPLAAVTTKSPTEVHLDR
ncbi:sensor histidine kinase [Streptomyces tendae]|uniref:sensor histidine kinase n=1 Tax=Streptomyces tendae TaxID=1932 RepID=UPI003D653B76